MQQLIWPLQTALSLLQLTCSYKYVRNFNNSYDIVEIVNSEEPMCVWIFNYRYLASRN